MALAELEKGEREESASSCPVSQPGSRAWGASLSLWGHQGAESRVYEIRRRVRTAQAAYPAPSLPFSEPEHSGRCARLNFEKGFVWPWLKDT